MEISANKVIFSQYQVRPAQDKYAASQRVFCQTETMGVWLSSSTVEFANIPLLEPCSLKAVVSRVSGAKGYYLLEVKSLSVSPLSRPNKS